MIKSIRRYPLDLLALVAGMILPLAFAPFFLFPIGIIAPLFLLYVWNNASPREAARRGFLFGLGYFSVGVSWLYISIHVFGQAPTLLAILITFLFVSYLALFIAVPGYCLNRFSPNHSFFKFLLVFPSLWMLFEILRTWLFTGFPWLLLGYSQSQSWLKGFAPFFGVYGVSMLCTFISGALFLVWLEKRWPLRLFLTILVMALFGLGYELEKINWTHPSGSKLTATLIQGNIEQDLKWQPEQILRTLQLYNRHTRDNWSSQLIVWPEAAITLSLENAQEFIQDLAQSAKQNHSTIITGIPVVTPDQAYNSMIVIGNGSGIYHKRHLVPFGEYIPLKPFWQFMLNILHIPMSNFERGKDNQLPLVADQTYIAPYICYEVAYPLEFLSFLPKAQLLLTITDDSWFGHSIASAQHLQMAQMRALETGRYLLFSSNTGITAILDPKGNNVKALPAFQEAVLTATVTPMSGSTPWMIWKMWPMAGLMLLTFTILGILSYRRRHVPFALRSEASRRV